MRLTASDFYGYHRPSKCDLRVYLRHRGEPESAPGPYEEAIRRLGERHEKEHLATLGQVVDLSSVSAEEQAVRTLEMIKAQTPVIYQGLLSANVEVGGTICQIIGEPDFLILKSGQYQIRDSKIARRITEDDHPEILRQLELYGWLYEQETGQPPAGLQVHSGTGEIIEVPYDGGNAALAVLREVLALKQLNAEPYSPVGWTKCNGCCFSDRCWPRAEESHDVALVAGVDQGLAVVLHTEGVRTIDEFLAGFDEARLSDFKRPWGKNTQRVGKRSASILRMARAMATGEETLLKPPKIPECPNYVMFDLEGLPPQLDELDKVFLWGLQVFGERPSEFLSATAGFGPEGDREGWDRFLALTSRIFDEYGDIPFVHWHHYERVRLDTYMKRFGDPDSIAIRVRKNLLDLLRVTQESIVLPLPSYSLKVVEKYVGFNRTQGEYGGDWAMAKYSEATETQDEKQRAEIIDEVLVYNREDLEATWAVFRWLKAKSG